MVMYGSDKPDLRNPIKAADVSDLFKDSSFAVFAEVVAKGGVVRAIPAPGAADRSRSFFDKTVGVGETLGPPGVAYIVNGDTPKGPLAKYVAEDVRERCSSGRCEEGRRGVLRRRPGRDLMRPIDGLRGISGASWA
jgi:aspartyl-tRNA synthetase